VSAVRAVVEHDHRLAILDCLDGRGPLTIARLAEILSWTVRKVRYHVGRLDAHDLVDRSGLEKGPTGVERRYTVDLDERAEWVRDAVEDYRRKNEPE
jgi:predicted ArsR family transcriptional regulator